MGLLDRLKGAVSTGLAAPSVPPHWWQLPTLAPGFDAIGVVGESNYQPALEHAAQGRTPDGCRVQHVMTQLVREPRNKYDRNAVRVDIDGRTVGYVPREDAPSLHHVLDHLASHGYPATCRAYLRGGWDRGRDDRGSIGCVLDLAQPLAVFDPATCGALPEGTRVSVTREEHYADRLGALLGGAKSRDVAASLRVVDADPHAKKPGPSIEVRADGVIGYLTAKMTERHTPLLRFAEEHGLPLTTRTRIERGEKKVEAFVRLPKDPTPLVVTPG